MISNTVKPVLHRGLASHGYSVSPQHKFLYIKVPCHDNENITAPICLRILFCLFAFILNWYCDDGQNVWSGTTRFVPRVLSIKGDELIRRNLPDFTSSDNSFIRILVPLTWVVYNANDIFRHSGVRDRLIENGINRGLA